jgi:hypothetical protein
MMNFGTPASVGGGVARRAGRSVQYPYDRKAVRPNAPPPMKTVLKWGLRLGAAAAGLPLLF